MDFRRTELEDLNLNLAKLVGLIEMQLKYIAVVQRILRSIAGGIIILIALGVTLLLR